MKNIFLNQICLWTCAGRNLEDLPPVESEYIEATYTTKAKSVEIKNGVRGDYSINFRDMQINSGLLTLNRRVKRFERKVSPPSSASRSDASQTTSTSVDSIPQEALVIFSPFFGREQDSVKVTTEHLTAKPRLVDATEEEFRRMLAADIDDCKVHMTGPIQICHHWVIIHSSQAAPKRMPSSAIHTSIIIHITFNRSVLRYLEHFSTWRHRGSFILV